MKRSGLLKELQKLTSSERLAIIEAALQRLPAYGGSTRIQALCRKKEMAAAAKALQTDYATGGPGYV